MRTNKLFEDQIHDKLALYIKTVTSYTC